MRLTWEGVALDKQIKDFPHSPFGPTPTDIASRTDESALALTDCENYRVISKGKIRNLSTHRAKRIE